jgi:predicted ATPase/class 3 adenylate cyclase
VGELPRGTVTLLFTDIEGSTALVRELGDTYPRALAEHRRCLRDAFAARDGVELGAEGDALFFAFAAASDAFAAALDGQRALAGGLVRVRMGLHSGAPTIVDGEYVGLDLHQAARVTAAGHGGQVLLSAATRALLADDAPVRDLGEHRLKDLTEPVRIYQAGDAAFPPLATLSQAHLPAPATPLVGRQAELAEARALVLRHRLLTLVGPGGTGKSRLALGIAEETVADFPDGAYWVDLSAIREPALVEPAIAHALDAGDELLGRVGRKRLLLVLDNLEQVTEAASALARLLAAARGLTLLATSREALGIDGEQLFPVPPLRADEAVALFVARARAIVPDFMPDAAVAEICRRLDGLPLAIELAAARIRVLEPEALLARLERRLPLLTGGRRDLPERHRTLRATIEWSQELLPPAEQTLFARLGVFAGGATLDAAEAVCDADLDSLQALVVKSLVRAGSGRVRMLETIREYALERLDGSGEAAAIRRRHAEYFARLADEAEPELAGPDPVHWLATLEREHDNFRAALEWTLADDGDGDRAHRGLCLAAALGRFWYLHAHAVEGVSWLERALARDPRGASAPARRARALHALGVLRDELGEHAHAAEVLREAVALHRAGGDDAWLARSLNSLGVVARNGGDLPAARELLAESLALRRALGDLAGVAVTTCDLGLVCVDEGDVAAARALFEESLALDRERGDRTGIAVNLVNLASVAIEAGDLPRAARLLAEGSCEFAELGDRDGVAESLEQGAAVAARAGRPRAAGRLAGAAAALRETIGMPLAGADRIRLDGHLAHARDAIGAERYTAAFRDGQELSEEDALAELRRELSRLAGGGA